MSQTISLSHPILCSAWSSNGKMVAFAGTSQKIAVYHKIIGGAIKTPAVQSLAGHLHNIGKINLFIVQNFTTRWHMVKIQLILCFHQPQLCHLKGSFSGLEM